MSSHAAHCSHWMVGRGHTWAWAAWMRWGRSCCALDCADCALEAAAPPALALGAALCASVRMRASSSCTPTISCRLTSSALRCSARCAPYLFCGISHAAKGQQCFLKEVPLRLTSRVCVLTAVSMVAEVRRRHLLS